MADEPKKPPRLKAGDLSVTALYTSQVWRWGNLPCADLFDLRQARAVYRAVNAALAIGHFLRGEKFLLRQALLQRHVLIDRLVRDARPAQVLEIACGLSRRGADLSADPALTYVELDRPNVIELKRSLLASSAAGQGVVARANYRLVAGDAIKDELASIAKPVPSQVVIAEGLFMYLDVGAQGELWRRIAGYLREGGGGLLLFDRVPLPEQPPPGVLGRALGFVMGRFTGGRRFAVDRRTRAEIEADVRAAGFHEVEAIEPRLHATAYDLPFAGELTEQLVWRCRVTALSGR